MLEHVFELPFPLDDLELPFPFWFDDENKVPSRWRFCGRTLCVEQCVVGVLELCWCDAGGVDIDSGMVVSKLNKASSRKINIVLCIILYMICCTTYQLRPSLDNVHVCIKAVNMYKYKAQHKYCRS